jgi:hypothetical protein
LTPPLFYKYNHGLQGKWGLGKCREKLERNWEREKFFEANPPLQGSKALEG